MNRSNTVIPLLGTFLLVVGLPAAGAPMRPDDVRVEGMTLSLPAHDASFAIEPPPILAHEAELELPDGDPSWRTRPRLPVVAWILGALTPGSLTVARVDRPDEPLAEGDDYRLDETWGALTAVAGGRAPPGTRVRCTYRYSLSRIDLIERRHDGRIAYQPGTPHRSRPRMPAPSEGATPLLSLYLGPNTTRLTMENVNLIDPDYDGVPPVHGAEHLARARARLAGDEPVTIVFLGDSIPAQPDRDFSDGQGSFVSRFAASLAGRHPHRRLRVTSRREPVEAQAGDLVIVQAGVGGQTSRQGRARMETDVLPHRPDVLVIFFGANDDNVPAPGGAHAVPPDAYRENLRAMALQAREAGAEVILMTPGMKMAGWAHTGGDLRAYADAIRALARDIPVCVVDSHRAWEDLPRLGYRPAVYLETCINHPNELGHELFRRGLDAAFID